MNPKPVIVASCCAVLFVAIVYFRGKSILEQGRVEDITSSVSKKSREVKVDREVDGNNHTPSGTPATNTTDELITSQSVTSEPAPPVDTGMHNTAVDAETHATEAELVSPHGFGPYPKLPVGYPSSYWEDTRDNPALELMCRVRIKLENQGVNVRGVGMHNGKVYPSIPGTVYIEWADDELGGSYITYMRGHPEDDLDYIADQLNTGEVPDGITVLDYESSGIDPYEFLDLPRQKEQ